MKKLVMLFIAIGAAGGGYVYMNPQVLDRFRGPGPATVPVEYPPARGHSGGEARQATPPAGRSPSRNGLDLEEPALAPRGGDNPFTSYNSASSSEAVRSPRTHGEGRAAPHPAEAASDSEAVKQNVEAYLEVKRTEEQWRKYPPAGFYLLKLRDQYQAIARRPLDANTSQQVESDVARLQSVIEEAEDLYKDFLKRERQNKLSDNTDTWLVSLISDCESAMERYKGAPACRNIETVWKRWKALNERSIDEMKDVQDKEREMNDDLGKATSETDRERRKARHYRRLISDYRSIVKGYPGSEGAQQARARWEQLEDELR